jgi:hypothetical protein
MITHIVNIRGGIMYILYIRIGSLDSLDIFKTSFLRCVRVRFCVYTIYTTNAARTNKTNISRFPAIQSR